MNVGMIMPGVQPGECDGTNVAGYDQGDVMMSLVAGHMLLPLGVPHDWDLLHFEATSTPGS